MATDPSPCPHQLYLIVSLKETPISASLQRPTFCPLCGPDKPIKRTFYRSDHLLVACGGCGIVYLHDLPKEVDDQFYQDVTTKKTNEDAIEYWSFPANFTKYQPIFNQFFAQRWQWIQQAKPDVQSLLDVGCGYGFFLHYMQSRLPITHGLELDPNVAEFARSHFGLSVDSLRIEAFQPETQFDCIVLCDVLEHLPDPVMILKRCRDLLTPGGLLFLQVPNLIGFKLPLAHSWGLPHHIWQFGPENLNRLVAHCGLTPYAWHTGILGVIGVHEQGGPTWKDRLIWAIANKLRIGNRLMVMAVKPQ